LLKKYFLSFCTIARKLSNLPKKIRNSHILQYILYAYSENPFTFDCLDVITFQNFCFKILIHFCNKSLHSYEFIWILYRHFFLFAYWKLAYRKYREVMHAFWRKSLFVQRKSIFVLAFKVKKLHMDKITIQTRTNLSIALQTVDWQY